MQALDADDTLTDTFTVTTIDGTEQVVTITIHGANDADPNDFDYLATGKTVICDPPYVYGTPETTASRVAVTTVRSSTGAPATTPSMAPANATSSTPAPATTRSRATTATTGSTAARETIRSTAIMAAIPSSVDMERTSSRAATGTIVSFICPPQIQTRPGTTLSPISDRVLTRIDLTALGALAFLALTSASTSVPAHTIAWFYDSTTNQTILYVNPTDHILDIGNSALLEIHLEGLVTVQASDFVPEPTAAPVVVAAKSINPELMATAETDAAAVTT